MSADAICPQCGRALPASVLEGPSQAVVRCQGCEAMLMWANGRVTRSAPARSTVLGVPGAAADPFDDAPLPALRPEQEDDDEDKPTEVVPTSSPLNVIAAVVDVPDTAPGPLVDVSEWFDAKGNPIPPPNQDKAAGATRDGAKAAGAARDGAKASTGPAKPAAPARSPATKGAARMPPPPAPAIPRRPATTTQALPSMRKPTEAAEKAGAEKSAPLAVDKPAPLRAEKSAPVSVEKSAAPATARPAPVAAEKSAPVRAAKPTPARVDKPTPPAVEKSAPAAVDNSGPLAVDAAAPTRAEMSGPLRVDSPAPSTDEKSGPLSLPPPTAPPEPEAAEAARVLRPTPTPTPPPLTATENGSNGVLVANATAGRPPSFSEPLLIPKDPKRSLILYSIAGGAALLVVVMLVVFLKKPKQPLVAAATKAPAVAAPAPAPEPPPPAPPAAADKNVAPPPAPAAAAPAPAEPAASADAERHPRRHHTLGGKKVVLEYEPKPSTASAPIAAPTPQGEDPAVVARARDAYHRGNLRLFAGDDNGAMALYREALQVYPGYVAGYRGLGLAYEAAGDQANSMKAFRLYVKTVPHAADAPIIQKRIDRLSKILGKKASP